MLRGRLKVLVTHFYYREGDLRDWFLLKKFLYPGTILIFVKRRRANVLKHTLMYVQKSLADIRSKASAQMS